LNKEYIKIRNKKLNTKFIDTDSLTIATTKTGQIIGNTRLEEMEKIFLPIVKKEKLAEFKTVWGDWLVLSNKIVDEKTPGKLKTEFSTRNGEMIALAPKSYFSYCRDTENTKDGRKGIPKWFQLGINNFYDILYNDEAKKNIAEVRSLRLDKDKRMTRTTTRKSGLTSIHVKLGVQSDRVTCVPLKLDGKYL